MAAIHESVLGGWFEGIWTSATTWFTQTWSDLTTRAGEIVGGIGQSGSRSSPGRSGSALGYLLRQQDAADLTAHVHRLRTDWRRYDKDSPDSLGFKFFAVSNGGRVSDLVEAKTLAYAWLYGDLVHADDDIRERVGEHAIDDRYRAGAILIANVARCTITTLNLVRTMQQRGLLALPDYVFTQRVIAEPGAELRLAQAVGGPVGA